MKLSIIIPVLNEADNILSALNALQNMRKHQHEIILVDGGSTDNSIELATPLVDRIIQTKQSRALQMNAGAEAANGDIYWFLHNDTIVADDYDQLIVQQLPRSGKHWGRFNVRLSGRHPLFTIIATMMNLRSRISGIATGDQGIFIDKISFKQINGYNDIALMEDINISKRLLKHVGRPLCLSDKITTSSRRWEQSGILKTIFLMWQLRLAYFFGANPESLAQRYRDY